MAPFVSRSSSILIVQSLIPFNTVTADSPILREALEKYHRGLITDNKRISELLLADYGIDMK